MSKLTISVSSDAVRQLLAIAEKEAQELRERLTAKEDEMRDLRRVLGIESKDEAPQVVAKKLPSGRTRKGEAERVVLAFLETHKGSGWSQSEIAEKTGISMSSAFRALRSLAKSGRVDGGDGTWGIAG